MILCYITLVYMVSCHLISDYEPMKRCRRSPTAFTGPLWSNSASKAPLKTSEKKKQSTRYSR